MPHGRPIAAQDQPHVAFVRVFFRRLDHQPIDTAVERYVAGLAFGQPELRAPVGDHPRQLRPTGIGVCVGIRIVRGSPHGRALRIEEREPGHVFLRPHQAPQHVQQFVVVVVRDAGKVGRLRDAMGIQLVIDSRGVHPHADSQGPHAHLETRRRHREEVDVSAGGEFTFPVDRDTAAPLRIEGRLVAEVRDQDLLDPGLPGGHELVLLAGDRAVEVNVVDLLAAVGVLAAADHAGVLFAGHAERVRDTAKHPPAVRRNGRPRRSDVQLVDDRLFLIDVTHVDRVGDSICHDAKPNDRLVLRCDPAAEVALLVDHVPVADVLLDRLSHAAGAGQRVDLADADLRALGNRQPGGLVERGRTVVGRR